MTPGRSQIPLSVAPQPPATEPDLKRYHKQAILAAIRWAWKELTALDPATLASGSEDAITERLQTLLNMHRNGRRLAHWIEDFETVSRGENQKTTDGRLNKQPDLTFRPAPYRTVANRTRWGWFIECKIIDGSASVTAYCDKGVYRYCAGEYAACMSSAALLGYVRDSTAPIAALDGMLTNNLGTRWHRPVANRAESTSHHDRSGALPPCTSITLSHVWLPAK